MLSPVSLRICWIAAMAPALTEAANQADNFNLPASSNLNFAAPSLNELSLQTLSEIVSGKCKLSSSVTGDLISSQIHQKCIFAWKVLQSDGYSNGKHVHLPVNGRSSVVDRDTPRQNYPTGSTPAGEPVVRTMNRNRQCFSDAMGLIKANTSLECRNKANNLEPSQITPKTVDGELTKKLSGFGNERNSNVALRRLAFSDNFKNFQWSKTNVSTVDDATSNVFLQNGLLRSRARLLLRRVRKLQLRQVDCHSRVQLRSFVENQQNVLGIPCQRQSLDGQLVKAKNTEELKAELLQSQDVKLLSTAALVELVRKLEHATSVKQARNFCDRDDHKGLSVLDSSQRRNIGRACCSLLGSIRHLEFVADSDATESSSGGESTDEMTDCEEGNRTHLLRMDPSLSKKQAAMTWAEDRAAAASQWTWLQAQVSDLEYKIRQQNDLYRQVRASKGAVVLEGGLRRDGLSPRLTADAKELPEQPESTPKSVNGFLDGISNGYRRLIEAEDSCRTRPMKKLFRKRKLVGAVRRNVRLSSVRCSCNCLKELSPCVLCGGRYNSTQTLDADIMPLSERVALLDSSYHMVLSLKPDMPLSLHFERLLRREEYCKVSKAHLPIQKKSRLSVRASLSDQARKHSRKLAKNAAQTLLTSAKLRKKLGTQRRNKHGCFLLSSREDRKKFKTLAVAYRRRVHQRSNSVSSESSKPGSPVPSLSLACGPDSTGSSGKVSSLQELLRRRRLESAYDINNIVIPYSVAATTRVEKLQYKEILTPKWRLVKSDENASLDCCQLEDEEVEDMSEDTFATRHLRCEQEEKRRFLGYKRLHGRSRMRSGANTPDPTSPHLHDDYYGWNSPVASPPPVLVQMEESALPPVRQERKRIISISKRLSEDEPSSLCGEEAVPYDRRVFPLTEEEYQQMLHFSSHLAAKNGSQWDVPGSPCASSSSCSVPEDDPNDPEWTVIAEDSRIHKASLILKLAKR